MSGLAEAERRPGYTAGMVVLNDQPTRHAILCLLLVACTGRVIVSTDAGRAPGDGGMADGSIGDAGSSVGSCAGQFYVSPSGTAGGDGSLANPWDLQTALWGPATVKPGDCIWLRGGTYTGSFNG